MWWHALNFLLLIGICIYSMRITNYVISLICSSMISMFLLSLIWPLFCLINFVFHREVELLMMKEKKNLIILINVISYYLRIKHNIFILMNIKEVKITCIKLMLVISFWPKAIHSYELAKFNQVNLHVEDKIGDWDSWKKLVLHKP